MPSPVTLSNELLCGEAFNRSLKALAGKRRRIKAVVVAKGAADPGGSALVSDADGPFPVYASWDLSGGTVTLTSEADRLLVNPDACGMFEGLRSLRRVDAAVLDTRRATNLSDMFARCSDDAFNPNVSGWDVSNVTDMSHMFADCSGDSFNPDVSRWDTSSLAYAIDMFGFCSGDAFSPDVSRWDMGRADDLFGMFAHCSGEGLSGIDLSGWRVGAGDRDLSRDFLEDMLGDMFEGCASLERIDVTGWSKKAVKVLSAEGACGFSRRKREGRVLLVRDHGAMRP